MFLRSILLASLALSTASWATVSYTTDSTTSLVGTFSLDTVDSFGMGTTIGNFPHFHFDLIDEDGYTIGESQFFVSYDPGGANPTITLEGDDLSSAVFSATRVYDVTGFPASYPDFNGAYSSPFDGQTISYSYTNIGFSGPIITGDFSFAVVPEPSAAALSLIAGFGLLRRKR